MTFVEAALELLREFAKPMTTEELARLAVARGLLSRPGADPAKSMATRLATEAKKGAKASIESQGKDSWALAAAASPAKSKAKAAAKPAKAAAKPAKAAAKPAKAAAKPAKAAAKPAKAAAKPARAAAKPAEAAAKAKGAAKKPTKATPRKGAKTASAATPTTEGAVAPAPVAETAVPVLESPAPAAVIAATPSVVTLEGGAPPVVLDDAPPLAELDQVLALDKSPSRLGLAGPEDEAEVASLYGDEIQEGEVLRANEEYRDAQTADEDRPMLPEISNRRDFRDRHRRDGRDGSGRRRRRDRPERDRDRDRDKDRGPRREGAVAGEAAAAPTARAQEPRRPREAATPVSGSAAPTVAPLAATPALPPVAVGVDLVLTASNALAAGARSALDQAGHSQPVQIKQLAQMMKKRQLFAGDPERDWPTLKAALLADANVRLRVGLEPLLSYRGRDLFAPTSSSDGAAAETALATAVIHHRLATRQALRERMASASPAGFERAVHAYLLQRGFDNVRWVKRVEATSYGSAIAPDGLGEVLIAARSGGDEIDRRGIGELRAGVAAKDLSAGMLLAPSTMSADARSELSRPGKSITVLCGNALVEAFAATGVGMQAQAAVIERLDDTFLSEVVERA